MAKQQHTKEKGLGFDLVGTQEELLKKLINDGPAADRANAQIGNEGPAHKQVQNALLLRQLAQVVKTVEKATGATFAPQSGYSVVAKGPEHETEIPLPIPKSLFKTSDDSEKILEKISKGPEHEILMYSLIFQVLGWVNKEMKNLPTAA